MYQINFIVWPVIFGMTGFHAGSYFGTFPGILGAAAGTVAGFMTAVLMVREMFYDVEAIAPVAVILTYIFVPAQHRIWFLLGTCLLPWLRLTIQAVLTVRGK